MLVIQAMAYPFGGLTGLAYERQEQVQQLLLKFPACVAVNQERTVFDLPLDLKDGKATALRITLPPHFPNDKPLLSVLIPVPHPAVSSTGRVHTPKVEKWVYGQTSLVEVVSEAVAVLQSGDGDGRGSPYPRAHSPAMGPLTQARAHWRNQSPPNKGQSASKGDMGAASPREGPPGPRYPTGGVSGPSFTTPPLPDLSHLSVEEVETLTQDEAACKTFIRATLHRHPMAEALKAARERNKELARSNISKESTINDAKNTLAVVRSSEYDLAKQQCDSLYQRQQAVMSKLDPVGLKEQLENLASEVDTRSAVLVTALMAGSLPVDQFVEDYLSLRVDFHIADLKRQAANHLV